LFERGGMGNWGDGRGKRSKRKQETRSEQKGKVRLSSQWGQSKGVNQETKETQMRGGGLGEGKRLEHARRSIKKSRDRSTGVMRRKREGGIIAGVTVQGKKGLEHLSMKKTP